jgi:glycosyltransferase involved in cell wall biosynthesis
MRITILQGAFLPVPPVRGGAVEKMWFELGQQFSRQGHSVCHVSRGFPGLPPREEIGGVRFVRVKGYDTPANGWTLKALDLIYSWRALRVLPVADVLVTNTFWMPILAAGLQRRRGRIMVDVQRMPKGQLRFYGKVACLRANSSAVRQAIVREVPWLAGRVCTIPNPLPLLPAAVANNVRGKVILYCGRLHPEKGIDLLIRAFARARQRGLNGWTLRLVGPADVAAGGGGVAWLEGLLAGPQAARQPIEWLGPVYDGEDLQRHYKESAIFVYPSLAEQGETFGLAPLEAMACGAVPIVSDLACFRDFITPGVNGLVFDHRSADAEQLLAAQIVQLANDSGQRATLSQAARGVCQTHHPEAIAAEFLQCFERMMTQEPLSS